MIVARLLVCLCLSAVFLGQAASLHAQRPDWMSQATKGKSRYYVVKSDLPKAEIRMMAKHMDGTYESYMELFSKLPMRFKAPKSLSLYIFDKKGDYLDTLSEEFRVSGEGSQGMCIPNRGNTILAGWRGDIGNAGLKRLLQHEGFHQVAEGLFDEMPPWANEGMAEVFGHGVFINGRLALGSMPKEEKAELVAAIEGDRVRSFEYLFSLNQRAWNEHLTAAGGAQMNYEQCWSICHFFCYAEQGRYQRRFLQFLVNMNSEKDWEKAFAKAFGRVAYDDIEKKWKRYLKKVVPTDYEQTILRLHFLAAGMKKLRESKIYPASFDELKQELQAIDFANEVKRNGEIHRITASDASSFEVPFAADAKKLKRSFVLVDSRGRKPKDSYKKSKRAPVPLNIMTTGLFPRRFVARWKKSKQKYHFTISSETEKLAKQR